MTLHSIVRNTIFLFLISCSLISCNNSDVEVVDAYTMQSGETKLFTDIDSFLKEWGAPDTIINYKDTFNIKDETELKLVLESIKEVNDITLKYPGVEMWYNPTEKIVIPYLFDFRKTNKVIKYNDLFFDNNFALEKYKQIFPQSYVMGLELNKSELQISSLFQIVTNEKGPEYQSFSVIRITKDDPFATPMIEFTFKEGALVYMFFANF